MRKIALILAILFIAGMAEATAPDFEGTKYVDELNALDIPRYSNVIKVRNSYTNDGCVGDNDLERIQSGDAVKWDTTSIDALTVVGCSGVTDQILGIAVTDILSSTNGIVDQGDQNWGYVCIEGYALASFDAATGVGAKGTVSGFAATSSWSGTLTSDVSTAAATTLSADEGSVQIMTIGSSTDSGLVPVWLH